jgi:hypothetical protein
MPVMTAGYRRYLSGLKRADCLLVTKTRNPDFMRLIVEPPVPRRRPDLTAFIHKPLEVSPVFSFISGLVCMADACGINIFLLGASIAY